MKIITTVGTSLLQNADIDSDFQRELSQEPYEKWLDTLVEKRKQNCLKDIKKFVDNETTLSKICAEIASILAIQKENIGKEIEVYLIATDTVASVLCAVEIQKILQEQQIDVFFEQNERYIIEGLQVKYKKDFEKKGLPNLVRQLNYIAQSGYYWEDCVLNITGGYKALIPFMTIIGQVNNVPIYYLFQENDEQKFELIKIPQTPITFNIDLFNTFFNEFQLLENEEITTINKFSNDFLEKAKSCLEIDESDNSIWISPLGVILWNKFVAQFFIFYTDDNIWIEINNNEKLRNCIKNNFSKKEIRDGHTEMKPANNKVHRCYDGGGNNPRIFYFIDEGKICIYRVFEGHTAPYETYLQSLNNKEFGSTEKNELLSKYSKKIFSLNP